MSTGSQTGPLYSGSLDINKLLIAGLLAGLALFAIVRFSDNSPPSGPTLAQPSVPSLIPPALPPVLPTCPGGNCRRPIKAFVTNCPYCRNAIQVTPNETGALIEATKTAAKLAP